MKLKSLVLGSAVALALSYTATASAAGPAYSGGGSNYICTHHGSNVMLRSGPGQNYRILARMPSGSYVSILSSRNAGNWTWHKVRYGRSVGWARADYVC